MLASVELIRYPAQLLKEYGLDKPVLVQYGINFGKVLKGELG